MSALPAELPSEAEIMSAWPADAPVMVSVVCTTFNHAGYIRRTLAGFLAQRTDFAFEIIIHDDASTDTTAGIVSEYAARYPQLIRTILQRDNQFSLGHKVMPLAVSHARAAVVALCEGDDYWCDPDKLQRQYHALRAHPGVRISYHNVWRGSGAEFMLHVAADEASNHQRLVSLDELIQHTGDYCPSPSLMIRREVFETLPPWFLSRAPVGDYYLQLLAAHGGGALYLPEPMAVYRINAEGSWSQAQRQSLRDKARFQRYQRFMAGHEYCLTLLRTQWGAAHHAAIDHALARRWYDAALTCLYSGRLTAFRNAIERSTSHLLISGAQRLLHGGRRWPRLCLLVLRLRRQYRRSRRHGRRFRRGETG